MRFSLRPSFASLAVVALSVLAAGSTACSGGSAGAEGDSTDVPTHLDGLYEASGSGDLQWIAFSEPTTYSLLRSGSDCGGDTVPASCFSVGLYTVDASARELHLKDVTTGEERVLPLSVVTAAAAPKAVSLTTQDDSLVTSGGSSSGSSGGALVNQSGAPLTNSTPGAISLTNGDGTNQSLVSSPSDCGTCPSSSGGSSTQSETVRGIGHVSAFDLRNTMQAVMLVCGIINGPLVAGAGMPPVMTLEDIDTSKNKQCSFSTKKPNN